MAIPIYSTTVLCDIYLYFVPHVTFSSDFLLAITFLHVLHLDETSEDRLRLKLKVKVLMYGYNAGPLVAIPIYYHTV